MTKQIFLSLLNCSWQWVLLGGLTWFITGAVFRKKRRSNTTVHLLWLLSLLSLPILFGFKSVCASTLYRWKPGVRINTGGINTGGASKHVGFSYASHRPTGSFIRGQRHANRKSTPYSG